MLGGRIQCVYTKHEMPANIYILKMHLSGKKFKMAKECYSMDYTKYEPHIVPHKSNNKKLFCKVTKLEINKIPAQVENHVNGPLKRALAKRKITFARPVEAEGENDSEEERWIPSAPISDEEGGSEVDDELDGDFDGLDGSSGESDDDEFEVVAVKEPPGGIIEHNSEGDDDDAEAISKMKESFRNKRENGIEEKTKENSKGQKGTKKGTLSTKPTKAMELTLEHKVPTESNKKTLKGKVTPTTSANKGLQKETQKPTTQTKTTLQANNVATKPALKKPRTK